VRWGLDASIPPTGDQAWLYFADGYSFFCGYVGGRTPHVWTREDWRILAAAGFDLLPIWVAPLADDAGHHQGVEDGNRCLLALQAVGLTGVVALDVENGLKPREYASGFAAAIRAGDCAPVLYGTQRTIEGIGDLPWSAWWLAYWPVQRSGYTTSAPDWSMWQFKVADTVDMDVAVDDFPFALLESPEAPSAPPAGEA
jgi:hypothetical protein